SLRGSPVNDTTANVSGREQMARWLRRDARLARAWTAGLPTRSNSRTTPAATAAATAFAEWCDDSNNWLGTTALVDLTTIAEHWRAEATRSAIRWGHMACRHVLGGRRDRRG